MTKRTQKEFIERARSIHGEKYDYSKSIYIGALEDIEIICRKHSSFWQQANLHLRGANCPICTGRFLNLELFIQRANTVHKHEYTYENAMYGGSRSKISITCE
jgi:hypothetical protein